MRTTNWGALVLLVVASCSASAPTPTTGTGGSTTPTTGTTPSPSGLPSATSPLCERPECPSTAPMYPTQQCSDGVHIGGRGPCVRFADGTCNWSGLVCAAAGAAPCAASDCGLPVPSSWTCPDGSIGDFTCVRDAGGRCGATYRPCPAGSTTVSPPPPPPPNPHPCSPLPADRELLTWPIGEICQPGGGPAQPPRVFIKSLGDGTQIIEQLGKCLRVRQVQCNTKCLPGDARISTPSGDIAVKDLRVGMEVWSRNANGTRVSAPIVRVGRVPITGVHHVARIALSDGRTLVVSPEHPALDGLVQDLRAGDAYDGATVIRVDLVRYTGTETFDLLPANNGMYWADGVPLRSTLHDP